MSKAPLAPLSSPTFTGKMVDIKPLTIYERALLRLEAFKILEGWGTKPHGQKLKIWDMNERKRQAILLAEWSATAL